jgi:hypothetical protein
LESLKGFGKNPQLSGVTVFTTNLALNYHTAFIRRIVGHIEMPLACFFNLSGGQFDTP